MNAPKLDRWHYCSGCDRMVYGECKNEHRFCACGRMLAPLDGKTCVTCIAMSERPEGLKPKAAS